MVKRSVATATSTHPPANDHVPRSITEDWHIITHERVNVLLAGARDAIEETLQALSQHLDGPIRWCSAEEHDLLRDHPSTLVIRNLDRLSETRQHDVLSWLEHPRHERPRIVSTTTIPLSELLQRVASGQFNEVLYYRLNTVLCRCEVAKEEQPETGYDRAATDVSARKSR